MAQSFVCIRVSVPDDEAAGLVVAEAWEAGASGVEEREGTGVEERVLLIYAPASEAAELSAGLERVLPRRACFERPEVVPDIDWSQRWREGLATLVISPRLAVRPSFVTFQPEADQQVVVIDPRQAFGTGSHASTHLALQLLSSQESELEGQRILDLGTGSGVLALAALRLGASKVLACDLDIVAVREAHANAVSNGLDDRLSIFAGSLAALERTGFDLVLANLLRSELLPLLPALARRTRDAGRWILSGLLADDRPVLEAALAPLGVRIATACQRPDANGVEWLALLTVR